jgi:mannose-6-phosphate isomerase-like protein (cupin superfamily)
MQRTNERDQTWRNGNSGVKYLGRGPRIDWGLVKLQPGEELGAHFHKAVEETFYFPEGSPKIIVAGKEIRVSAGDSFRVEPGETHDIVNDTSSDVIAVFIKTPYDPDDKVSAK